MQRLVAINGFIQQDSKIKLLISRTMHTNAMSTTNKQESIENHCKIMFSFLKEDFPKVVNTQTTTMVFIKTSTKTRKVAANFSSKGFHLNNRKPKFSSNLSKNFPQTFNNPNQYTRICSKPNVNFCLLHSLRQ